ncbi:MAG: PP2C family protein-serine/threonine phosphatase [Thermoanaerobaculia bacterium]
MDYKALLTQVEKTIEAIDTGSDTGQTISTIAETIASNFQSELGISGGRLYELHGDDYELIYRFGKANKGDIGILVSKDYVPIALTLENGVVVMEPTDPGVDPVLEKKLGAQRFAAISVGDENYILSFSVPPDVIRDDVLFSLNLIRYSINQKLRAERLEAFIAEAQMIQQSILPQRIPIYEGYDIWGKTLPAEIVSGDYYDFIPVSESILGLAIADASGHGLPAALMVRDVHMGIRMGTDRDFKIIRTLQKLNRIIHRSKLSTKFVSLFYGELETNGVFIYCNAGHPPPFIYKGKNSFDDLRNGGMILGPTPDATYNRGFAQLEGGDILCLYSDGVTEAHDREEKEFGVDRLKRLVKNNSEKSAQEIGQEILQRIGRWSRRAEDDRTVVIVKAQ